MVNYGVKVTIIEFLDRALPNEDADVSKEIARQYKKYGVDILTSTKVETVVDSGDKVTVTYTGRRTARRARSRPTRCSCPSASPPTSKASASRRPASSSPTAARSTIDDYMRTNVPHIYAIGDVTAKLQLAHVAEAQGVVAAETIGKRRDHDARRLPHDAARHVLLARRSPRSASPSSRPATPATTSRSRSSRSPPTARRTAWASPRLRQAHRRRRAPRAARRPPGGPRRLELPSSSRSRRSGTSPPSRRRATCTRTRRCRRRCRRPFHGLAGHMINP